MFGKIKNNKIFMVLLPVLFLAVIPLTLVLTGQTQEQRSGAAGEAISIILSPLTKPIQVGETLGIEMKLNAGLNNITAIDITITYDAALLEGNTASGAANPIFANDARFSTVLLETQKAGTIHWVGVNPTQTAIGGTVDFAKLVFKAKASGVASVGFSDIHVNASGVSGALPINTDDTKPGAYTIIVSAPSPSTFNSPTPVPTIPVVGNKTLYDFNDDGKVDEIDLNILYGSFRTRQGD